MNKKSLILVAGVIALASGVAACTHARVSEDAVADYAAWMAERVSRDLDLTEQQKSRLTALKTALLAARREAREEHAGDHQEVTALLAQPTLDRARALALVTTRTRAIDTKAGELIAVAGDFYDSLLPEQQAKLRERVMEHMNDHPWH